MSAIVVIILTIAFVSYAGRAESEVATSLMTITEGARWGDALVTSGTGQCHVERTYVDSLSMRTKLSRESSKEKKEGSSVVFQNHQEYEIDHVFHDGAHRVTYESFALSPYDGMYLQHREYSYNGEVMKLLRLDSLGINGFITPYGDVYDREPMLQIFNPPHYGLLIQGTPVAAYFEGASVKFSGSPEPQDGPTHLEDRKLDGIRTHVFQSIGETSSDTLTVWIAPERMYRPVRYTVTSKGTMIEVTTSFRSCGNDVWFPERIMVNNYYRSIRTGEFMIERTELCEIADSYQVNVDITDSELAFEFPAGLKVFDHRTKETHIAGTGD